MSTTLANINTLVNDRRRDTGSASIDMSTNGFRALNSTLQIWNEVHDWPWTIKTVNINYNAGVDTYPLDGFITDFKYPLTLKYYKPQGRSQEFWMVSPLRFDSAYIYADRFAIQNLAGIQTIRIRSCSGIAASINTATAYNQNGLWVGASAISSVATDNYEGFSLPSSVSFIYNGSAGTLTNSTFTSINLTSFQNRSNIYFDIYIPSVTNLTSFTLQWGTNNLNYYQGSATTDYCGAAFTIGWNRIKISWSSIPTTVGTPTVGQIAYLQLTVTTAGSNNLGLFRVQNFFVSDNVPIALTYYSTNMVVTAAGVQSQVFTNSANTTDLPMWSGRWDVATEAFLDSAMQIIFWMTGEYNDMGVAMSKIQDIIYPLKQRYPSQRRYPTMQIIPDVNFQSGGPRGGYYDGNPDF